MKKGHSCWFTKDYKDFLRDLGKMSCGFGGKVYGFTKHGSGKFKLTRRHDPNCDREKFIEYASDNVAVI